MGFNFSAFAGGFAKEAVSSIEKEEELATLRGANGAKVLYENYKTVLSDNRKLENELKANIDTLRAYDPSATEAELLAVATKKPVMDYVTAQIKKENFDPETFKLSNIASIANDNVKSTALDLIRENLRIPKAVSDAENPFAVKKTGNIFNDIQGAAGGRAAEKAARQTADALGVSYEDLLAAKGYKRPEMNIEATYNMGGVKLTKTFDQQVDAAQSKLAIATKANDKKGMGEANADLMIFKEVKSKLSPAQTEFANKIADVKNRYMFGDAQTRKAAKPEYDKLMADVRAEAMAKKTGEGDGESKIPALSTLNTFTSASVARAVAAKHGNLINSKQLAIVEKADGSVGIDYIGDNIETRRQILETQATAAKNALSLYTDAQGKPLNRDVASVMNSFTSVVPSVVRTDGGATPAAAGPQPTAKPTASTPAAKSTSTIPAPKTKAEYDALPPGTRYIDTDGKTKDKS
jgi:hypothetical protein